MSSSGVIAADKPWGAARRLVQLSLAVPCPCDMLAGSASKGTEAQTCGKPKEGMQPPIPHSVNLRKRNWAKAECSSSMVLRTTLSLRTSSKGNRQQRHFQKCVVITAALQARQESHCWPWANREGKSYKGKILLSKTTWRKLSLFPLQSVPPGFFCKSKVLSK